MLSTLNIDFAGVCVCVFSPSSLTPTTLATFADNNELNLIISFEAYCLSSDMLRWPKNGLTRARAHSQVNTVWMKRK